MIERNKRILLLRVELIRDFLKQHLDLNLHPDKIRLQPLSHGIDFLGYFIKPTHTLVRKSVVGRFKRRLWRAINPNDGLLPVSAIPMIQSCLGHFGHANTYNLKKKLLVLDIL